MVRALGVDLCDVARLARAVERTGERFLRRVFTETERRDCDGRAALLARVFAAKEAAFKALGRGWPHGVSYSEVEVRQEGPRPTVVLSGRAGERATLLGLARWHVALSDDGSLAVAVIVVESA